MSKRTVLIVEDDDSIRRLLTATLRQGAAVAVDVARDGAEALHRIRQRDYAVILLDLMLPHMSGIDLLDSLSALARDGGGRPPFRAPGIIVITAAPGEDIPDSQIQRHYPDAVTRIFRKPVDLPELMSQIERML